MAQTSEKRVIVLNILSGNLAMNNASPVIEPSVLSALSEKKRPELKDPYRVWFLGIPILLALCGLVILAHDILDTPLKTSLAILTFLTVFCLVWHFAHQRSEKLIVHARILEEPLQEIVQLHGVIKKFLGTLDQRTGKFFHVVTNSKVTSYFVLSQMITSLEERMKEVRELLDDPTLENVLVAHQLLQGTLVFRDNLSAQHGNAHVIPLARVKMVAEQLMDYLDTEIKMLEQELKEQNP